MPLKKKKFTLFHRVSNATKNCHKIPNSTKLSQQKISTGSFQSEPYLTNVGQVNSTCPMLHRQVVVDVGQVAE